MRVKQPYLSTCASSQIHESKYGKLPFDIRRCLLHFLKALEASVQDKNTSFTNMSEIIKQLEGINESNMPRVF